MDLHTGAVGFLQKKPEGIPSRVRPERPREIFRPWLKCRSIVCITAGANLEKDGIEMGGTERVNDRSERILLDASLGALRPIETGGGGNPYGADFAFRWGGKRVESGGGCPNCCKE
jgi:hypothetical protein